LLRIFLAVCLLTVSCGAGLASDEPVEVKIGEETVVLYVKVV